MTLIASKDNSNHSSIITIDLTTHEPHTPLGIVLAPEVPPSSSSSSSFTPTSSTITRVVGWQKCSSMNQTLSMGPIQRSGRVRIGDRLVRINQISVQERSFENILGLLKSFTNARSNAGGSTGSKLQSLGFEAYSASKNGGTGEGGRNGTTAGPEKRRTWNVLHNDSRSLYSFSSCIEGIQMVQEERTEEGESPSTNPNTLMERYAQYEIKCQLLLRPSSHALSNMEETTPYDRIYNWTIWKRYTEFSALHEELQTEYQWQMAALMQSGSLTFPPAKNIRYWWTKATTFKETGESAISSSHERIKAFGSKAEESFVQQRRTELQRYWEGLQSCTLLFEFGNPTSHRYATTMANFLNITAYLHPRSAIPAAGISAPFDQAPHQGRMTTNEDQDGNEVGIQPSDMSTISQLSFPSTTPDVNLSTSVVQEDSARPKQVQGTKVPSTPKGSRTDDQSRIPHSSPGSVTTASDGARKSPTRRRRRKNQAAFQRRLAMESL